MNNETAPIDATDAIEEVGVEPSANEGTKTAHATPSRSGSTWLPSMKSALSGTNSEHQGQGQGGGGILTSVNPCCCFTCAGCSFLLACKAIAIYAILTSLPPLIVAIAWVSVDSLPPEKRVFQGGMPGVAGISGISFTQLGPKPSLSFGYPKLDIPCGIFGLLAGLFILGVCLCEKKKPDKPKVLTIILAILCWLSCVFLFIHFFSALASIAHQRSAVKIKDKKQLNNVFFKKREGISKALGILLILVIVHAVVCIYLIVCVFILGFKILQKKTRAGDDHDPNGPKQGAKSGAQPNHPSHARLIEGDGGTLHKLSLVNPCYCFKCAWFKLSLVCCGIGIYLFWMSLPPLILGIGIGSLDARFSAPLGNLGTLDTSCGVLGLLAGLILFTVGLYDMLKADKSKLVNFILAILCWISCLFIFFHFCLAFASLLKQHSVLNDGKGGGGPGRQRLRSIQRTKQDYNLFFSRDVSSGYPVTIQRIVDIDDNHNEILMLIIVHFLLCVYFLVLICFFSFRFLQESKNAAARIRPA